MAAIVEENLISLRHSRIVDQELLKGLKDIPTFGLLIGQDTDLSFGDTELVDQKNP
jgi:hypothetical protein